MDITQFKKTYEHKKVVENKNKVAENPLVTVCIQTYQHVDYIKECLDGILNQKTNFDFEILLRDDASTDGTQEICSAYKRKYPEFINLLLYSENQFQKGVKPFPDNVKRAQGKYIALCEGDDYWTDPLKLQKQVDFLEENEEYVVCCHNAKILDEKHGMLDYMIYKSNTDKEFSSKQLKLGVQMHPLTMVYRNLDAIKNPKPKYKIINGDTFLISRLGKHGKGFFMSNVKPSVYRQHSQGVWSGLDTYERAKNKVFLYRTLVDYHSDDQTIQKELHALERGAAKRMYDNFSVKKHQRSELVKCLKLYFKSNSIFTRRIDFSHFFNTSIHHLKKKS